VKDKWSADEATPLKKEKCNCFVTSFRRLKQVARYGLFATMNIHAQNIQAHTEKFQRSKGVN
jgi:hypothetical protein